MTGKDGYVWFLPNWFLPNWWMGSSDVGCTPRELNHAIQGYWTMANEVLGPRDSVIQGNLTVKQWTEQYMHRLEVLASLVSIKSLALTFHCLVTVV